LQLQRRFFPDCANLQPAPNGARVPYNRCFTKKMSVLNCSRLVTCRTWTGVALTHDALYYWLYIPVFCIGIWPCTLLLVIYSCVLHRYMAVCVHGYQPRVDRSCKKGEFLLRQCRFEFSKLNNFSPMKDIIPNFC
jgi:hypothetical protein